MMANAVASLGANGQLVDESISRKSGHRFSAGNATKYKEIERFPIQRNREAL